jgi:hypothetical protein
VALAQYHYSLTEQASIGIIPANKRQEENVAIHILEQ